MANVPAKITDNLLNVFNYCFVETVPYAFYKPDERRDIAVNLIGKEYHCELCGKVSEVTYRYNGVTYYSKGKLKEQQAIYEKLKKAFPTRPQIDAGEEFFNQAVGICSKCAEEKVLTDNKPEQKVYNLCEELHNADELLVVKARMAMEKALRDWLDGMDSAEKFQQYDMSDFNKVRDLICAVMLDDTEEVAAALAEYQEQVKESQEKIEKLLAELPEKWQAYAARSTRIYESMSDELYHEYTVAFPKEDTKGENYYIYRTIEKDKIKMFLDQPRINTLEELLTEVGFHGEWIDMINQHIESLIK